MTHDGAVPLVFERLSDRICPADHGQVADPPAETTQWSLVGANPSVLTGISDTTNRRASRILWSTDSPNDWADSHNSTLGR